MSASMARTQLRTRAVRCAARARVLVLTVAALVLPLANAAARSDPNLVVIVVDDLGWEDLALVATPNIDALIGSGVLFLEHRTDPAGAPTRFALNYGAYGVRAGLGIDLDPADPTSVGASTERVSIAQSLRMKRYESACFGMWGITGAADANTAAAARICGWGHWFAGVRCAIDPATGESHTQWERIDDGAVTHETMYSTTAVVDAFVAWWSLATTRPRLAYVAFPAPGAPFEAAPTALLPVGHPTPTTDRERFESAIVALDTELGRLVAALDMSRTIVVLTSDGGTPSQVPPPTGLFNGYGSTIWSGALRVPLVVAGAGVVPGISTRLTHPVDVPATLLELAGRTAPPVGFEDGISFAPDLAGTPTSREPILCLFFRPNGAPAPQLERWCVIDAAGNELVWNGVQERLFDLAVDPFESNPLPIGPPGTDPIPDMLRLVKQSIAP